MIIRSRKTTIIFISIAVFCFCAYASAKNKSVNSGNQSSVASQLLFGGFSKKHIVETAASHNGSVLSKRTATASVPDTIRIIALRIEFNNGNADTTPTTTGNGLFGSLRYDPAEAKYYNDNVYKYDHLPHYATYFSHQLDYAQYYFQMVSRGNLNIIYSIFPSGDNAAYDVPLPMTAYGPGSKKKEETFAQYNERINIRLIKFIRDAVISANKDLDSPFSSLHYAPDKENGFVFDSDGHRCVFLIIHAGSSFLTDGGLQGAASANSPSDMIDAFITPGYFDFYKDTLGLKTAGIEVKGRGDTTFLVDEVMMVSETSNQDSLNWGIHGILVNQIARQLGIPDLFATSSGTTAVGAFCIMDFYGYSASPSQGFIPPWPCAWVRAFMGWDTPIVMPIGSQNKVKLKAISEAKQGDTSIVLIPLNDHEYYLLENRQRNLSHDPSIFKYDTATGIGITIDPAFSLNLDNNIIDTSKDGSACILKVKNFDASLPASGVVVWHVDENIIKNRLKYDYLNSDSAYRAITMVEADGINDIGIAFQDIFFQLAFDAGGAEDVFPHKTKKTDSTFSIMGFGPFSKPSTHSNDGGQTYLKIDIQPTNSSDTEANSIRDYMVTNYSDTFFTVSASWDYLSPGWPKRMVVDSGEKYFDPVLLRQNGAADLVTLSKKGRLYVWPVNSQTPASLGDTRDSVKYISTIQNDSLKNAPSIISMKSLSLDTLRYFSLPGAFTFPTVVNNNLFVPINNPKSDTSVYIIKSISNLSVSKDIVPLPSAPTTYVCKLAGNYWAIGCANGTVFSADTINYSTDFKIAKLPTNSPVCAIAALANEPGKFVCIQDNDSLSLDSVGKSSPLSTIKVPSGIPPFSLVTGDINNDGINEIIVCDSRKGLWVFTHDSMSYSLKNAPGWEQAPVDWATAGDTSPDRRTHAINTTAPALADINNDGRLEIIVGGSNGLYAINYKGVIIGGWPAYLDNRFFRGNVACSPAIVSAPPGSSGPLVIYQSPTGENETFEIDTIIKTDKATGKIIFLKTDGTTDSITGLTATYIDSALVLGDSLILPFTLPGGLVDAIDPSGKRPLVTFPNNSNQLYSRWPLSIGSPQGASPLFDTIGDSVNLFAIGNNGWAYRWKLTSDMVGASLIWKQTGYDGSRPFAYLAGPLGNTTLQNPSIQEFFSWPNPTNGSRFANFTWKFNASAKNVRLDIFTYTGLHVFSQANLSGSFPGENQLSAPVSIAKYGSGVYRCRFEAEVGGKKCVQFWKMAVVK